MFQVKPPSAVCTCLAWLSPSDIAIGCSNGFIGVWNIAKTGIESHQDPTPYIYAPVHPTYVLSISSAYPSHPHVLASSCIDGQMKLFSLRDPLVDVCEGIRMRFGTMNLEYSPYFRAFVTTDDNEFVRLQPIRRFFSTMCVLRSASNTVVTACSPCHPSVIAGTAGGQAMATNPLRRMFNSKSSHQQQTWFSHEWVHVKGDDKGERLGASRFLDGFKAESPNLMRGMQTAKLSGITIYEEETAITALACNPNEPYAGWTCAGMGSGLLRVEDLTLRPA